MAQRSIYERLCIFSQEFREPRVDALETYLRFRRTVRPGVGMLASCPVVACKKDLFFGKASDVSWALPLPSKISSMVPANETSTKHVEEQEISIFQATLGSHLRQLKIENARHVRILRTISFLFGMKGLHFVKGDLFPANLKEPQAIIGIIFFQEEAFESHEVIKDIFDRETMRPETYLGQSSEVYVDGLYRRVAISFSTNLRYRLIATQGAKVVPRLGAGAKESNQEYLPSFPVKPLSPLSRLEKRPS